MAFYTDNSNPYGGGNSGGQGVLLSSKNKIRKAGDKVKAISDAAQAAGPGPGAGSNPYQAANDPLNSKPYGEPATTDGQRRNGQGQGQGVNANQANVLNRKGEAREYYTPDRERIKMGKADLENPDKDFNPFTESDINNFDLGAAGKGAHKDNQKLSKKDVRGLLKQGGHSVEDVQGLIDSLNERNAAGEDVKAGKGAQNYLNNYIKRLEGGGDKPGEDSPGGTKPPGNDKPGNENPGTGNPGTGTTPPPPQTGGHGGTAGNTNNQEVTNTNRQTGGDVSVGGDNSGTIDNSVNNTTNTEINNNQRSYGGSSRTMNVYGTGSGGGGAAGALDGVATAGTLSGYYAPDDSPAAQSKFVNFYADENKGLQSQYADYGTDTANKWVTTAAKNNPIDFEALDKRISGRQIYHQDQATLKQNEYMGDMWKFTPDDYVMPKALKNHDYSERLGEATEEAYDQIDNV